MTNGQIKEACAKYYDRTVTRNINGQTLYATDYKPGLSRSLKLHPLGWFKSEKEALQALYDYLKANQRI